MALVLSKILIFPGGSLNILADSPGFAFPKIDTRSLSFFSDYCFSEVSGLLLESDRVSGVVVDGAVFFGSAMVLGYFKFNMFFQDYDQLYKNELRTPSRPNFRLRGVVARRELPPAEYR